MKSILTIACFLIVTCVAAGVPEAPAVHSARVEVGKINAVVVKQVLPSYPLALYQRGLEGSVVLEIAVDAQGKVVAIKTVHTTDWEFAAEARRAVWQWRFAKSEQMLPDERVRYLLPVEFRVRRS